MADLYNDGTLVHGTATLTFSTAGAAITDPDWSLTKGSKRVEQTNANGEPIKAFGLATTPEGSCTIQVATAVIPGETFQSDKVVTNPVTIFLVTEIVSTWAKEDYLKQQIKFVQKIN